MRADQVDGLLDAAALGHDVFRHDDLLTGLQLEAALQDELVVLLVGEDGFDVEGAGDLLPDEEAADGRRDHGFGVDPGGFDAGGEFLAEFFPDPRLLEDERGLEETVAVLLAAELEMSGQQCAGGLECGDDFLVCHDADVPFFLGD